MKPIGSPSSAGVCGAPSLKIGMYASLLGGDTAGWIVDEHSFQKVKSVVVQSINESP